MAQGEAGGLPRAGEALGACDRVARGGAAMAETAELREVLAEMMRRGRTSQELCEALQAADPDSFTLPSAGTD